MKIGEISKKSNLSIATIRYYINTGLIVPKKRNTKYHFSEDDLEIVLLITRLKAMGFSIQEIHRVISLKRVSNWVEPEDLIDYANILQEKKKDLEAHVQETRRQMQIIDREIQELESRHLFSEQTTGVPTQALELLHCPRCHKPLQLENAQMNYRFILQSALSCPCGYCAQIKDGVLHTFGEAISRYDKPDINRTIYKDIPNELVTQFQQAYNWILPRLKQTDSPQVIMETHLNSFFFLYTHFEALHPGNFYIIVDKFEEIIQMYKRNIERLGIQPNILYIVNNDSQLPLRQGAVDCLVDFCSSNEHSIFSSSHYLQEIERYLKPRSRVLSTYFSFDEGSRSIHTLRASYPENAPDNYKLKYFRQGFRESFRAIEHERIGVAKNSGEGIAFIFHQEGENLYIDCFLLEHTPPDPA